MKNSNNVKITIIVPSFNEETYIGKCIESIINQSIKEIEIICVDAGSNDKTLDILKKYALNDKRIQIIISDKKSYGYQVNLGIKKAKGEYLGIVEADDFVDVKMYEELLGYASNLNADLVKCPYIEYFNNNTKYVCYYADFLNKTLPEKLFSAKDYGYLLAYHASVWAGIYKKEFLLKEKIRFVEAQGAGYVDVGFRYETCTKTNRCAWYKKPLYYYRVSNENSSTNNFKTSIMIERWKELLCKIEKNKEEFDKYYLPFLLFDEYVNTLAYMHTKRMDENELQNMIDLYKYVNEESIDLSPVIPINIKKRIKKFKRNPKEYYRKNQVIARINEPLYTLIKKVLPKGTKKRHIIKKILFLRKEKID